MWLRVSMVRSKNEPLAIAENVRLEPYGGESAAERQAYQKVDALMRTLWLHGPEGVAREADSAPLTESQDTGQAGRQRATDGGLHPHGYAPGSLGGCFQRPAGKNGC